MTPNNNKKETYRRTFNQITSLLTIEQINNYNKNDKTIIIKHKQSFKKIIISKKYNIISKKPKFSKGNNDAKRAKKKNTGRASYYTNKKKKQQQAAHGI